MAATAIVTITHADGDIYVDATCDDGSDVTMLEALGMLELAKSILIEQAL